MTQDETLDEIAERLSHFHPHVAVRCFACDGRGWLHDYTDNRMSCVTCNGIGLYNRPDGVAKRAGIRAALAQAVAMERARWSDAQLERIAEAADQEASEVDDSYSVVLRALKRVAHTSPDHNKEG